MARFNRGERASPETVTFMRWADGAGVESYEREVTWVREVRARTVLSMSRGKGKPEVRILSEYGSAYGGLTAVERAMAAASEAARAAGCLRGGFSPEAEVSVEALEWHVPRVADEGGVPGSVPAGWFLEEPKALKAWLLACARDRRIEAPARRLEDRPGPAGAVWRSQATPAANLALAAAFEAACRAAPEAEADGPSPGM